MSNVGPKILIATSSISRSNGGESSILDFAETLHLLGFDVTLATEQSTFLYLIYGRFWIGKFLPFAKFGRWSYKTEIPFRKIVSWGMSPPFSYSKAYTNGELSIKVFFKESLRKLLNIIDLILKPRFNFRENLKSIDILFIGLPVLGPQFELLRAHCPGYFLGNHAGSRDAFERYWIKADGVEANNTASKIYIESFQKLDGVLFQADDQAIESGLSRINNQPDIFVLPPTCQEREVLRSKNQPSPYAAGTINIVSIGSIQKRKAQHLAIEACHQILKENLNIHLHFIGVLHEKDYVKSIFSRISELGLEKSIHLHGHRDDYLRYHAHADCLLQTSEAEGVSRVLRESMLLKVPIISFDISGTRSLLSGDGDSILIECFDIYKMRDAIDGLLNSKTLSLSITRKAFNRYLEANSWLIYANRLTQMIHEISKSHYKRIKCNSTY